MAKVRNLSDIQQEIAFTEFDFYQRYEESFKTSELGRIKSLLPLREMAISFGLVEEKPKSLRYQRPEHQSPAAAMVGRRDTAAAAEDNRKIRLIPMI